MQRKMQYNNLGEIDHILQYLFTLDMKKRTRHIT